MLVEFARMSLDDGLVMQLHPGAVRNHNRWLHANHGRDVGRRHPAGDRLHPRPAAAAGRVRQRAAAAAGRLHPRRGHLHPRARPARRRVRRGVPGRPVVVPRLARGAAAVPGDRDRDGRFLQHGRLRRRHPGLLLDPGPPRRLPAHRRRVPGPAGRRAPTAAGRGGTDHCGPRLPPAAPGVPARPPTNEAP